MDTKPLSLTDEIATRQRVQPFLSFYNYLPDPDPILKKLGKDSKVFADIKSDSHVFSTIQQRKGIVQSLLWEIDKGNATAREVKFIEDIFSNLDVDEIINRMLNTVFNGFSIHEINWVQDGGYFIPSEIIEKPNDWFIFDNDNKPLLCTMNKPFGEQLPDRKFILLQYNASYDNPYGERALAKCFWPVMFKRGGLKFWATMTEKYGMPFIIGKQPRGTKQEETNDLLDHLENMVQDAVAVVPDDSSVEFLEGSKTTSSALYKELLEFCNSEISKAILTQTLTTELQGDGSRAATETHKSLLESLADKKIVERGLNQMIRWTCDANFDNGKYPLFRLYQEEDVDKDLADRDAILVGQCGVKFTKEYYAKNYNLDEQDFEITEPKPATPEPAPAAEFAESEIKDYQAILDSMVNNIPPEYLQKQMEKILKPALDYLKKDISFSEMEEGIMKLYPDMNTEELQDRIAKMIFIAEIIGREDAKRG